MNGIIKTLAALSALLFMDHAAQAATARCFNCSDAQMFSMARSLGASSLAHIVWDPVSGNVKRYRNYCGSAPNSAGQSAKPEAASAACNLQTEEQQVSSDLVGVASALGRIWQHTSGTFKADINASVGGINYSSYYPRKPTAHDFQGDCQLRAEIVDLASSEAIFSYSSSTVAAALAYIASHIDAFLPMKQGVFVTIKIQFYDGSSIKLLLKLGEVPTYVANSARDSTGHALPDPTELQHGYSGRWNFAPGQNSDMSAFIEYMRSLGVTVTSGQLPNGQVNCVWTPATNTTTCYIPR